MKTYNDLFAKKAGIIPITEYPKFWEKYGTYLKSSNPHVIFSNHKVNCAKCGYHYTKKALMQLNWADLGISPGYGGKKLHIRKCIKCGNTKIRITIGKSKTTSLKGAFNTVLVCGQVQRVDARFQKAEDKLVKWMKTDQQKNLSPTVQINKLHFGRVPDSHNRKLIDAFVQKLLKDKGYGHKDYQVKAFNKDGYHFLIVYF